MSNEAKNAFISIYEGNRVEESRKEYQRLYEFMILFQFNILDMVDEDKVIAIEPLLKYHEKLLSINTNNKSIIERVKNLVNIEIELLKENLFFHKIAEQDDLDWLRIADGIMRGLVLLLVPRKYHFHMRY